MEKVTEYCGILPTDVVIHLWPQAAVLMDQALEYGYGEYLNTDVLVGLLQGRFQAFGFVSDGTLECLLVSEIIVHPRKRILSINWGAGRNISRLQPCVMDFVVEQQIDLLETRTRPSLARLLRGKHGSNIRHVVSVLEV